MSATTGNSFFYPKFKRTTPRFVMGISSNSDARLAITTHEHHLKHPFTAGKKKGVHPSPKYAPPSNPALFHQDNRCLK